MMFYFTVIVYGVSLISGIISTPSIAKTDESDIQELLRNFEDARNEHIRQFERYKRILETLISKNAIKKRKAASNNGDIDMHDVLRELGNMLDNQADLVDGDVPHLREDQDDIEQTTLNRRYKVWGCWWCGTRG